MGSKEFAQAVRGSGAEPINTSANSAIETDNYDTGEGFDFDGSDYPYTVDPSFTAEIMQLMETDDILIQITTVKGNTFDFKPVGGTGIVDWVSIDHIDIEDPEGTGARVVGVLGGDE